MWDVLEEDFEQYKFEDYCTMIIIYDIISNKRRLMLSKMLSGFGFRIQKSAFECNLSKEKCDKLIRLIDEFAQPNDLIRIYKLNRNVVTKVYGEKLNVENEPYYFI